MGKMLTQSQVAKKLGCGRTKVVTLRKDKHNPLPSFRLGRMVRIDEADLIEWLDKQRVAEEVDSIIADDLFEMSEREAGDFVMVRKSDLLQAIDLLARF